MITKIEIESVRSGRRTARGCWLGGLIVGLLPFATQAADSAPEPTVTVAVAKVCRENLAREIHFEAEFRPYQEIDLHAKVAGYLEEINVDVGDLVIAHQKIATLEVPELRDELAHAQIVAQRSEQEVNRSQAAYEDAHTTAGRLASISKSQPNLIAQQEVDTIKAREAGAEATLAGARLAVKEAQSSVDKLKTLLRYTTITAPFSGVITKRFADPGALIQAGISSSTQAMPLVRLSQMDKLRLTFPVSMSFVDKVRVGDAIEIRSTSSDLVIQAKLSRLTRKVDSATRTMEVEADIPNADLKIIPGSYASVTLRLDRRDHTLAVPSEAVTRTKGATVYLINSKNELEERSVKLGLETSSEVEVLEGLHENDLVMVGAHRGFKPGQKVEPKLMPRVAVQ